RRGAEVVQCYVAPPAPRLVRPPKELAGFAKVWLDPGETATVEITLDERAFAYWDPGLPERDELARRAAGVPMADRRDPDPEPGWRVDAGTYALQVGRSSAAIDHVVTVEVVAAGGGDGDRAGPRPARGDAAAARGCTAQPTARSSLSSPDSLDPVDSPDSRAAARRSSVPLIVRRLRSVRSSTPEIRWLSSRAASGRRSSFHSVTRHPVSVGSMR